MAMAGLFIRSLARPANPATRRRTTAVLAAAFSSTPACNRDVNPAKRKKNFKKGNPMENAAPVKKPAPGERKAFRTRIQTSNGNALPVKGLSEMKPQTLADSSSAGRMFSIPSDVVDRLLALRAFKTTQPWSLFRHPHSLVRRQTVHLAQRMDAGRENAEEPLRCVLTGPRLAGKSLLLLQAMTHALLNEWVVINIPEGQDLTNGNTDYSPIRDTKPLQFSQPTYTLQLLQTILQVNGTVLSNLPLRLKWPHLGVFGRNSTIADLLLNTKEIEYAWPTFEALWQELNQPDRPPILLSLDGLAHINKISDYLDPIMKPVHAHELTLVRLFIDALSGKTKFRNGGAVIAATSCSNSPQLPSQDLVLSQIEAAQAGTEVPQANPYERGYDQRIHDALKTTFVLRVPNVSKEEGRALLEYWAASGVVKEVIDNRTVSEKWTLGGTASSARWRGWR
ncbi:hypothetical protein L249_3573 [Ophiocordyceps polyrhachis-furcata BCC 54312]|uniref:Small ribosomal subunit protein mS29 n=1 Tax=Ophiocordyceps polyrhachis-furcata BCC 54312 TaxID=1330021 RepID=A0A367LM87_9HYPO|nr:hypothetical protein L249_3573 [Ophiocordyceps polyrhachis-furcata BCC 54312]